MNYKLTTISGIRTCNPRYTKTGTIKSICFPEERFNSFYIQIHFDEGFMQGFGGIAYEDINQRDECLSSICNLFGVTIYEELIGKKVIVAFNEGYFNSIPRAIAPIESSQYFILDAWREDRGYPRYDTIKRKRESILSSIESLKEAILREKSRLDKLTKSFDEIY